MGDQSNIEWTTSTWNPTRGCSRVSDGCRNCFAERQAIRQIQTGYKGLIKRTSHGPAWTGAVRLVPELLDKPLHWRKPQRVFVNSMSDLFHEKVPDEWIDQIFAVMVRAHRHTFQVLTKRPDRMLAYMAAPDRAERVNRVVASMTGWTFRDGQRTFTWPRLNIHLGVSVEDQATADERIPLLLQTPAAVRFVSYEPALGPVHFRSIEARLPWMASEHDHFDALHPNIPDRIDWLIVGGESGPGARSCNVDWIRRAMQQCQAAGVPCFVKQLGAKPYEQHNVLDAVYLMLKDRKGGDPSEWPIELRVREFPQ